MASSKRREKERKRKSENRYIKDVKTDYEKALISIDFTIRVVKYITKAYLEQSTGC